MGSYSTHCICSTGQLNESKYTVHWHQIVLINGKNLATIGILLKIRSGPRENIYLFIYLSMYLFYLVKLVKHTCFTNADGGGKLVIAVVRSNCCSILKRIISTRWTGSRWKLKSLMTESCLISSINVWLPTFGTRLKNKISIIALFVLFNWSALGMTSGARVDRCENEMNQVRLKFNKWIVTSWKKKHILLLLHVKKIQQVKEAKETMTNNNCKLKQRQRRRNKWSVAMWRHTISISTEREGESIAWAINNH